MLRDIRTIEGDEISVGKPQERSIREKEKHQNNENHIRNFKRE